MIHVCSQLQVPAIYVIICHVVARRCIPKRPMSSDEKSIENKAHILTSSSLEASDNVLSAASNCLVTRRLHIAKNISYFTVTGYIDKTKPCEHLFCKLERSLSMK